MSSLTPELLNRSFYSQEGPADYFLMRLRFLMAIAGNQQDQMAELISAPLEYSGISLQFESGAEKEEAPGEKEQTSDRLIDQFVRIESHTLKHHTIETLLRHYLANAAFPQCPWMEITKQTSFRAFKSAVKESLIDRKPEDFREEAAQVILGISLENSDPRLTGVVENLQSFLKVFAFDWWENATTYNSTKHGLTAIPGSANLTVTPEDSKPIPVGFGDSLTFLERSKINAATFEWHQVTEWIPPRKTVLTTFLAALMLRSIWEVSRSRYTGEKISFRFTPDPDHASTQLLYSEDESGANQARMPLFREFVSLKSMPANTGSS